MDEDVYPEYYRKSDYIKGNNDKTPDPFQLAVIKKISERDVEVRLRVQIWTLTWSVLGHSYSST